MVTGIMTRRFTSRRIQPLVFFILCLEAPGGAIPMTDVPFEDRHNPAVREAEAKTAVQFMHLDHPGMESVRAAAEAGRWEDAVTRYRDHVLNRIRGFRDPWSGEHASSSPADRQALMEGQFDLRWPDGRRSLSIEPGRIPWGVIPEDAGDHERHTWLQFQDRILGIGRLAGPLLEAYRETGDVRFLRRWEAVMDDWALRMPAGFDAPGSAERNYFNKDGLQRFNSFLASLAKTLDEQPAFAQELDPHTLLRILFTALEEYGPAYWWPSLQTVFNHNHNALNAATTASWFVRDLAPGLRLERMMQEHWAHTRTYGITRDGSMIEIGDDGHLAMPMRLGSSYHVLQEIRPPWVDRYWDIRFRDMYNEMTRFQFRHLTPNGLGHRRNVVDHFDRTMNAWHEQRNYGGQGTVPMWVPEDVLREPEIRAVADTVWGRAREGEALSRNRKRNFDETLTRYPGMYEGPPHTISHFMPYAGLYYLRESWEPDAGFAHLLAQQKDHESSNINDMHQTSLRIWGYGYPLLNMPALNIDGQSIDPDDGRMTLRPGSKTDRLSSAPEKPLTTPWLSDAMFDYAAARYEGTYRNMDYRKPDGAPMPAGPAIRHVTTERILIQLRPMKLWTALDRVVATDGRDHDIRIGATAAVTKKAGATSDGYDILVDPSGNKLRIRNHDSPGLRMMLASPGEIEIATADAGKMRKFRSDLFPRGMVWGDAPLAFRSRTEGGRFIMAYLLEALPEPDADARVTELTDRSGPGFAGYDAVVGDRGRIAVRASDGPARTFRMGALETEATGLIVVEWNNQVEGLILGAVSASWGGQPLDLPGADVRLTSGADGPVCTAIPRPLEPPDIQSDTMYFIDSAVITITSAAPDTAILYTLDGSDPVPRNPSAELYREPLRITENTIIKARACRREWLRTIQPFRPFDASGIDVSAVRYARFEKRRPEPAVEPAPSARKPGLRAHYVEANWRRLFTHLGWPLRLEKSSETRVATLLDPADLATMRKTDGPFGVVYEGYLDVPETGVYVFHAPPEYVQPVAVPGYELHVYLDGQELILGRDWQDLGQWPAVLEKGLHRFAVSFADARDRNMSMDHVSLKFNFPLPHAVAPPPAPVLTWSRGGAPPSPIPPERLYHD